MEEARAVLARLERIETLDRDGTPASVMLAELRALVAEAEAWARAETVATPAAEGAIDRLRAAVDAAQPA